ncbi:hypothetical protein LMH87_005651 [Akanthomyces muscarius]|uniref:Tat pathway signal sequence n=1 Tax=Akanthomyces muscarius TaxID=2231603 RepID=A0A9W8QP81_AKAMU|nr:hypothetical protein LMH87_005651 [Akanthomyces muscarius]KAJ4163954.1 hypothetical protein LMH87_005651 [Akanthomyces muscarius]
MNMENSTTESESDPRLSEAFFCSEYRDEESPSCDGPIPAQPPYRRKTWALRHLGALFIHTIIFLIYTGIGIFCWNYFILHQHGCEGSAVLYTPIAKHVKDKITIIHDRPSDIKASPYVGSTTPEVDAAWYRLLRHHNIRITDDELHALNSTSIPLSSGGGSMGMMAVFHELHCLKLVREAVFADHYHAAKSSAERTSLAGHTEHCIDILRSAAMCRADTAIFTYHWNDATRLPNPTWMQMHQCRDWESLEEWLESRRIDIYTPNLLVHPKYGPAYPGGKRISEPHGPKVYPLDP